MRRACSLVALFLAGCSCEGNPVNPLKPGLSADLLVDFGDVPVGLSAERAVVVRNTGALTLTINELSLAPTFTSTTYSFSVEPSSFSFAPGESQTLRVRFLPVSVMLSAVESNFRVNTTASLDGAPLGATIRVRGRGISSRLEVTPDPLDFGAVLAGSSRTLRLNIRNPLSIPVPVISGVDTNGRPEVRPQAGRGQFVVLATPGAGGLLNGGQPLEPGSSFSLDVRFTPDPGELGPISRARFSLATCTSAICAFDTIFQGSGTDAALDCRPAAVEFGAVNPERTARRNIRCLNVVTDTIAITSWGLDPNSAPALSIDPFAPTTLGPGEGVDVGVGLMPSLADWNAHTDLSGTAVIRGENASTHDGIAPARIPLHGNAGGPAIGADPAQIEFGQIAVGTTDARALVIFNSGYEDLVVTSITSSVAVFSAGPSAFVLPAGTATVVRVSFAPVAEGPAQVGLEIASNDAVNPVLRVPVQGEGIALGPCSLRIDPPTVDFGAVELGQHPILPLLLSNVGLERCLIGHLALIPVAQTSSLGLSLANGPPGDAILGPGDTLNVPLQFAPSLPGLRAASVAFYVNSAAPSQRLVPVLGNGFGVTGVSCPAEITVEAGTAVSLAGQATSQTGTFSAVAWHIDAAPNGAIGTPNQWSPDPPTSLGETFLPYLVGRYELSLAVTDGLGMVATCTTAVNAVGRGFRVELTWDGLGDVDLHVHNSQNTPWFGRNGTVDDCFYANCNMQASPAGPIWDLGDPPYMGRNPSLDFDNIVGYGPENTRISDVGPGDTFTIALHYFWDHGHGTRTSTVNMYCGPVIRPTAVFVSRPMQGIDQGGCTTNDFWRVAEVTFTSSTTCQVTPLDSYSDGIDACAHL